MKLTAEQIQKIDQTLTDKGVVYEDIKLELIDHIATDIELENESFSFEEAFSKVMQKWEKGLKKKSSLWSSDFLPTIVVEKYTSLSVKQFKLSFFSVIVLSILMLTITILNPTEHTYKSLKSIFASLFIGLILVTLIISFFIWKSKTKTIYGRFFEKNCFLLGIYFYIFSKFLNGHSHLFKHYNTENLVGKFSEWLPSGFLFFMGLYSILMAIEHFKTVKKYKLT